MLSLYKIAFVLSIVIVATSSENVNSASDENRIIYNNNNNKWKNKMVVESGVTTTDSQWKIPGEAEDDFTKRSEVYAGEALNGMYVDCLAKISFSCVQKKVLNFINRMNRMEKFPVLGNYVSVVRIKNEYEKENEFQGRLDSAEKQSKLDELMDTAIDK